MNIKIKKTTPIPTSRYDAFKLLVVIPVLCISFVCWTTDCALVVLLSSAVDPVPTEFVPFVTKIRIQSQFHLKKFLTLKKEKGKDENNTDIHL